MAWRFRIRSRLRFERSRTHGGQDGQSGVTSNAAAKIRDPRDLAEALAAIAEAQARLGYLAEALETVRGIPDRTEGDDQNRAQDALQEIAAVQARARHFVNALEVVRQMEASWRQSAALREACEVVEVADYKIVLIDCEDLLRENRLRFNRLQPELANEQMMNWARFLKKQALAVGARILDTSGSSIEDCVSEIIALLDF
jgi:hypothetical protein